MTPTDRVKVKLTDGVHHLRYTNKALVRLEEHTGLALAELMERLGAGSLRAISAVVWAGLLHAEPNLKFDDAVDRIDLQDLEQVVDAAGKAIEAALGPAPTEEEERGAEGNVEVAATT